MGAARKGVWSAEGLREDLPETFGQGLRLLAAFFRIVPRKVFTRCLRTLPNSDLSSIMVGPRF